MSKDKKNELWPLICSFYPDYETYQSNTSREIPVFLCKQNMNIIEVKDITKHYSLGTQIVEALRGVSFDIEQGEFIAIMGPSGSGKSTLMNIIGCLDSPTNGTYYLNQQEVSTLEGDELAGIRNKEIGFVFQNFHLLAT